MNKVFVMLSGVAFVLIAGCSAPTGAGSVTQLTANVSQLTAKTSGKLVAEGRVVPAKNAALGYTVGGVISEILVKEGDQVKADQVLMRLDARAQSASVAQADASLRRALARLAALKVGPRTQEVTIAKAALEGAQAQLSRLKEGARPEDIAAVGATVDIAQADYQKVQDGTSQLQLETARADLANAQAVLKLRQADYDRVAYQPGAAARPETIALEQATNSYAAAKARYDDLAKGPSASSLAAAKARLQQAVAQYASVKAAPRQADIAGLQAEISRAQAQLELVQAGSRPEDIAAAQADVDVANAVLDQSKKALDDTQLRAPFDGIVAYMNINLGEQVAPGATVVRIGDTSSWEVNTTDLTEINVNSVSEGSKVTISVDALPGVELSGKVVRIRQYGENKQGDIVYTAVIQPEGETSKLRWNMTVSVNFDN